MPVLRLTGEAERALRELEERPQHAKFHRRVRRSLEQLAHDPRHPGLHSHQYAVAGRLHAAAVWESYVQNDAPGAWRIWWRYGPGDDVITVLLIGPHDCLRGVGRLPDGDG